MTQIVSALPQETYNVAQARADALAFLLSLKHTVADDVSLRLAVAGNGSGTVSVPGANRRIYARLGDAGGSVVEALCDQWTPNSGDTILLQKSRVGQGAALYLVVGYAAGMDGPCIPPEDV
jgi:hypothetical protein